MSVPHKRAKLITGVSSSSIVDLKSTLYEAELEAKRRRKEGVVGPLKKVRSAAQRLREEEKKKKNRGVENRSQRDFVSDRERGDERAREAARVAKLREKSRQYEELTRLGSSSVPLAHGDKGATSAALLVDFERKRWDEEDALAAKDTEAYDANADTRSEEERAERLRRWEERMQREIDEENDRETRRLNTQDVAAETIEQRRRLERVAEKRDEAAEKRRKLIAAKLQRAKLEKSLQS